MNSPVEKIEPVDPLLLTRFKLSFNSAGNCTVFRKDQVQELDGQWVWLIDACDGINARLYSASTVEALTAENAALLSRVERQAAAIDALEEWAGILRASTGSVELPTGDDRDPSDIYADVRKKIDAAHEDAKP